MQQPDFSLIFIKKAALKTVLILVSILGNCDIQAQTSNYAHDVKSIKNIGKAYYNCVSGPIGQLRDFDRLRNLFHPSAQLVYSYWSEDEQKNETMFMDIEMYIGKLDYLDKKGFYEEELYNKSETYGSIVQSISTYKFWMEDKSAEGRGLTSYNYFFDGERYWIMSMFWMMESDKFPIPKKYLQKQ